MYCNFITEVVKIGEEGVITEVVTIGEKGVVVTIGVLYGVFPFHLLRPPQAS